MGPHNLLTKKTAHCHSTTPWVRSHILRPLSQMSHATLATRIANTQKKNMAS